MVVRSKNLGSKVFDVIVYTLLAILALISLLPIINVLAISLSDRAASAANLVKFWPIGFHTKAYERILQDAGFGRSFLISIFRVLAGVTVNMVVLVLTSYPLSLEKKDFKHRNIFMWLIVFPMLFNGGLIPTFLVVRDVGLYGNFWSMIIPTALPIFSTIIMMNFFRQLPKSLREAALLDGASHFVVLFRIFIPVSLASIATLVLFSLVGHWNEWFYPIIYLPDSHMWPLQSYLRKMMLPAALQKNLTKSDLELLKYLSDKNFKSAQLFVAMIPIICVYPFLQKYFVKGLVIGSVKG